MSDAALALRQVGYTNKAFWRNPASAFFTFAFPLMFVVIFTSLLGSGDLTLNGVTINLSTYYVVAEAAFGVISATYTNVAISTTFNRDARHPEADTRYAAARVGVHVRQGDPRDDPGVHPRRDHGGVRGGLLLGEHPRPGSRSCSS